MEAVDLVDAEAVEQAVRDHRPRPAAALFGRLEHEHHAAVEGARLGEVPRGAEQHRGVAVVAAGVHLAGRLGGPGRARDLLDRQRVHVGPKADRTAPRPGPPVQHADHARPSEAGRHLVEPEGAQLFGDHGRRAVEVVEQLRMAVEVAAPLGDFGRDVGDAVENGQGTTSMG